MGQYFVYIVSSKKNGTLYVGVTRDLVRRIDEHKSKIVAGFTKKYSVATLVYFEVHDTSEAAITREKQIKEWKRQWKLELIEKQNAGWRDLYEDITK